MAEEKETLKATSKSYTLAVHQHRFAAWAAARAAQRGLASSRTIIDVLDGCGVVAVANAPDDWPRSVAAFDTMHRDWCRSLLRSLRSAGIDKATYGRAAKVIAIYLKSRIVLGGHHNTSFAMVIHPPIDRILLQGLADHLRAQDSRFASRLRTMTWTSLDEGSYDGLVASLRGAGLDQPAFWCIERFWDPRGDDD